MNSEQLTAVVESMQKLTYDRYLCVAEPFRFAIFVNTNVYVMFAEHIFGKLQRSRRGSCTAAERLGLGHGAASASLYSPIYLHILLYHYTPLHLTQTCSALLPAPLHLL